MKAKRIREKFHEPSLVPLADMLTNTVGILLFILIFTVLAAGGAIVPKSLPMERETKTEALYFACINNRILPLADGLDKEFLEPLGKPKSYNEVDEWIEKFNSRRVEDEFFVVQGEGEVHKTNFGFQSQASLDLALKFVPRDGKGDTATNLQSPDSHFLQILATHNPEERFTYFIVRPDSLDIFAMARELAIEKNFRTGWVPLDAGSPVRFNLTGGGVIARSQ